jgi:hypothetical protein
MTRRRFCNIVEKLREANADKNKILQLRGVIGDEAGAR